MKQILISPDSQDLSLPRKRRKASQGRHRSGGYTIIELLAVLCIMAVLAVASTPAIVALSASGRVNQSLADLSGALEIARQYAVAQNTFVWVAFNERTDANGVNQLSIAIIGSRDGTDPSVGSSIWTQYNYGQAPGNDLALINPVITVPQMQIENAGTFSFANLPDVQPSVCSNSNSVATLSSGFFTVNVPGAGPQAFTQAIEFLPDGEARNAQGTIDMVDIDVQPLRGNGANLPDTKNVAVLRVNGLTGETTVYRP